MAKDRKARGGRRLYGRSRTSWSRTGEIEIIVAGAKEGKTSESRTKDGRTNEGRIKGSKTEETGGRGEPEVSQTAGGRHGSKVVAGQEGDGSMVVCLCVSWMCGWVEWRRRMKS